MIPGEAPTPNLPEGVRRRPSGLGARRSDPYKHPGKLVAPSVCSQCGAIYFGNRWHWGPRPAGAHEVVCQACHRTNDKFPAGLVALSGGFVARNQAELIAMARRQEQSEKRDRPLNRILDIEQEPNRIVVHTADVQLPFRIGEAVRRTYGGTLQRHFDEERYFITMNWHRDA
jgi:hypothetical protein